MRFAPSVATAGALAVALSASAQDRFRSHSTISMKGDAIAVANVTSNSYGLTFTDVSEGVLGQAGTDVFAAESTLSVVSSTGMFLGASGSCFGSGRYTIDGTQSVLVDWNWSSIFGSGGWQIRDSANTIVAALNFDNGTYSTIGGAFSQSLIGNASVSLGAGTYTFESLFISSGNDNATVNFSFGAIPAPGAIAMLGIGGALGRSRRRA